MPPKSSSQNSPAPRGLLYILVSAFAFLFGYSLSKFRTPYEDGRKTATPQDTPSNESKQGFINPPIVSGIPASPSQQNYPNQGREGTPAWKKAAEICIAVGTAGLLTINIFLWYSTKNAANAAQESADTASRQLEMMDRPWIKEEVSPAANLMADRGAFSWGVTIRIDNAGHSVATNVYPRTELIAPKGADFIDGPRRRVMELCKDASQRAVNLKKDPMLWDTSVYPGDPVESNQSPILWPKDVEVATVDGGEKLGESVPLMLLGCIAYDYPTASKFHETGFVYLIVHNDDMSIPEPTRIFFSVSKTIPKDKLVMIKKGQVAN